MHDLNSTWAHYPWSLCPPYIFTIAHTATIDSFNLYHPIFPIVLCMIHLPLQVYPASPSTLALAVLNKVSRLPTCTIILS